MRHKLHETAKTLGRNIAMARLRLRITQAQLAEKIGYSVGSVSRLERGDIEEPSLALVAQVSRALRVSLEELIGGALLRPTTRPAPAKPPAPPPPTAPALVAHKAQPQVLSALKVADIFNSSRAEHELAIVYPNDLTLIEHVMQAALAADPADPAAWVRRSADAFHDCAIPWLRTARWRWTLWAAEPGRWMEADPVPEKAAPRARARVAGAETWGARGAR